MTNRARPLAICFALLLSVALAVPAVAITWGTRLKVATGGVTGATFNGALAVRGSTAIVTYRTDDGIFVRRSVDMGATWATPTLIQADGEPDYDAVGVAAHGMNIVVLYADVNYFAYNSHLYVKRSEDGGTTWKPRQTIATFGYSYPGVRGAIDMVGDSVAVAWASPEDNGVRIRRSADGGVAWLPAQKLGTAMVDYDNGWDAFIGVALTSSRVYLSWIPEVATNGVYGELLVMRRSIDGGTSFSPRQTLDTRDIDLENPPVIDAHGSTVLLHYSLLEEPYPVIVARSTNYGATFTRTTIATSTENVGYLSGDVFIGANGLARVVYQKYDYVGGADRVLLRTSSNGGATWDPYVTPIGTTPPDKAESAVVANATYTLVATTANGYTEVHARRGTN